MTAVVRVPLMVPRGAGVNVIDWLEVSAAVWEEYWAATVPEAFSIPIVADAPRSIRARPESPFPRRRYWKRTLPGPAS